MNSHEMVEPNNLNKIRLFPPLVVLWFVIWFCEREPGKLLAYELIRESGSDTELIFPAQHTGFPEIWLIKINLSPL